MSIKENLLNIKASLPDDVTLVAVSKTKSNEEIMEAYDSGQRIFGVNKIQEMTSKWLALPKDITWHMIGHVQSNKVKYMAPYVSLIHGVDSFKLLKEINKQAQKNDRVISCLLQMHIAEEATKFGFNREELETMIQSDSFNSLHNIKIFGLMGMATFTEDKDQVRQEFRSLKTNYVHFRKTLPHMNIVSMGMSGDYNIAIEEGSTMVRIGSSIFGMRNYP